MPVKKNTKNISIKNKKPRQIYDGAYIITVDMGYGHQRASYPLKDIAICPPEMDMAENKIITANNYPGIPKADRRRWEGGRSIYETVSRMFKLPFIGKILFGIMDYIQRIEPFYPRRDLSRATSQVRQQYSMIHRGWGKDLINRLNKKPLPIVTSFFTIAFFAEEHDYEGEIYCLCTDTDISRAWVPMNPKESRIKYFAPNKRVKDRLILYGINKNNIFVTGFPLPKENLGTNLKILKKSLSCRLDNLDPGGKYRQKYKKTLDHYFKYYEDEVKKLHLDTHNGHVHILYAETKDEYFKKFNELLLTTDILWTKPSELSFYVGLGIPIIMAPTIGSQEEFNKAWLHQIGSGFEQENPKYTNEWLFDWLHSGWLARAAMEGFLDAPRNGVYHIEDIVLRGKRSEIEDLHFL